MTEKQDKVNTPCLAYERMAQRWPLIDALRGGTLAMRRGARMWLPQEEEETTKSYNNRLARTVLFEGYTDAISRLVAKPFPKPVALKEAERLPERLREIEGNADGMGRSLTNFASDLLESALHYGVTHVLTDYSRQDEHATLHDERESGARPVLIHVEAPDLIGWRTRDVNGAAELTQVRIREFATEPHGAYGDREVMRVRVWNAPARDGSDEPGTWELWQRAKEDDDETWAIIERGTHTFDGVPLRTFYTNRTGFLTGSPTLESLAWINLMHWQSTSDQRNILRFARVGILFASGFEPKELKGGITVGPSRVVSSQNENANLQYVEHTGKAIEYGQNDLTDLENKMMFLGMLPMMTRTGVQTATAKAIDEAKAQNDAQAWVRNLETTIVGCYEDAAGWVNEPLPSEFAADVFNDFSLSIRAASDLEVLAKARERGEISHETWLHELKRRGLLPEDLDIEQEIQDAGEEAETAMRRTMDMMDKQTEPDDPDDNEGDRQ